MVLSGYRTACALITVFRHHWLLARETEARNTGKSQSKSEQRERSEGRGKKKKKRREREEERRREVLGIAQNQIYIHWIEPCSLVLWSISVRNRKKTR